ncbi:SIR2 family protein [Acinetobacter baumannii]|uniref:SIR2 family protein n=1 Tax=Acinetobacter baumannii TaxID=470 RepID=UPI00144AEE8E|nr:SIR2 family protein [Acinetobacter baumannii]MDV7620847.1 SIR2 family protein [Acinetobacter baumannii]NLP53196.1 Sir2 family NAD-dependent protein deacetylase [Acinetobacter baumannii]NQE73761.1 SIR2 family protein [Acinetobacter baumannii]QNT90102.1 SIR2 family protein [Acinetobacter baumannii]WEX32193.1 SIR2 family protein [Acinetobacter baumannii]
MSAYLHLNNLKQAYKDEKLMLFLGAGISSVLDLPNWGDLINLLAEDCGYEPSIFNILADGNALILAEFYYIKHYKKFGTLRTKLDQKWHTADSMAKLKTSKFHKILATKNFQLIYTTNYDQWIEKAFELYNEPFHKITDVLHISDAKKNVPQIVKFHGDFTDDSSIVLNESSYYRRMKFEDPIDVKFKSDLLNHSVLFMGYSLSDTNIRRVLFELNNCWPLEYRSRKPKCYIVVKSHNEIIDTVLEDWGVIPVTAEELGITDPDRNIQSANILEAISS